MTATLHPSTRKRNLIAQTSSVEPSRYNLRKCRKISASTIQVSSSSNPLVVPKHEVLLTEDCKSSVNSKWKIPTPGSLQKYASHTQDDLRKIFQGRRHRNIQLRHSEESDSSEEEESSVEKLEEKEGWKLLMKAIESKRKEHN